MPDTNAAPADVLGSKAPALSATSDMPGAASPAPAPASGAPTPAPAPADASAAAADASSQGQGDNADGKPGDGGANNDADGTGKGKDDTPPWAKREITIERNRRRAAEQQAAEATARLDEALKALQQRGGQDATTTTKALDAEDPKPARDQFDDPQKYDDALIEWSTRRAAAAVRADEQRAQLQRQQEAEQKQAHDAAQKLQKEWMDHRAKAMTEMPDFEEVAENPDVQITQTMGFAIVQAGEIGTKVQYHLGKNPELAARIAAMPPVMQLFELGQIAAEIKQASKPQVSRAPEPPKPLGARAPAVSKSVDEMSMEEYAARRQAQIREQRTH